MDGSNEASPAPGEQGLGDRVRQLRARQGLSVRTLAGRAGFSPSFISQVELGQASPSIGSLERIARVLGVGLGDLFRSEATPVVVRTGDRAGLVSRWSRAEVEALGPGGTGRCLEPVMLTLEPGGQSGGHPAGHAGEEFAIVFEGEVVLTLGDAVHRLGRGDAATFPAETPHRWENRGSEPARIVVVTAVSR